MMPQRGIWWHGIIAGVYWLAAIGCSPSHELETAPVSGKVFLDDQPLPNGFVFAIPSKGRMAKGAIQPDGTFTLGTYSTDDGAQVGTHPVIVTSVPREEISRLNIENPVAIPRRYANASTSQLKIDVKPGEQNEVELRLEGTN